MNQTAEYDAITEAYQDSKRLPFREYVERDTPFDTLGDVCEKAGLDVACGKGFPARLIKQAGVAAARTGAGPGENIGEFGQLCHGRDQLELAS